MNLKHTDMKIARTLTMILLLAAACCPPARADEYWDQKTSLFDVLPVYSDDIVFLGNSITDGGEFAELFDMPNIKNRGIRSDVITGVEKRLTQVTSGRPAKIFLLIGINDVSHGLTVDQLAARYERLVRKIREQTPDTKLYIQSVMPINNDFNRYKNLKGREKVIPSLNNRLQTIAAQNGAEYVDLTKALESAPDKLNPKYTNDGLHLNGPGYRAWARAILHLVKQ
jgi:lysophospholipase L1-like esterase